ncbi:hypothetical protein [Streptomyces formicae]|uniref:hypothetical protein n=1 Tax=Streptomyces formicae TaxID=1616117 RepID=UPI00131B322B|nr:hypothetical protein [Streptomyces formicae]
MITVRTEAAARTNVLVAADRRAAHARAHLGRDGPGWARGWCAGDAPEGGRRG